MQSKILLKRILIIALAVFALSAMFLLQFIPKSQAKTSSVENIPTLAKQEEAGFGIPVRIKIPKINIDAAVESAGLTSGGAMDIRKVPEAIAWFNLGTRPGNTGSAVIAGHYGYWKNGEVALFYNLDKLRKGDELYIEDDKGATIAFVVNGIKLYDPNEDASAVFVSNDGKAHLNLVTCAGAWDKVSRSYPKRLVVFTDKE